MNDTNDKVRKFCESVHGKLETLDGRLDSLKLNIGTTWHYLQEQLKEVRQRHETSRQPLIDARTSLELWFDENKAESKSTIDQWIRGRDTQQLAAGREGGRVCLTAIKIRRRALTMPSG